MPHPTTNRIVPNPSIRPESSRMIAEDVSRGADAGLNYDALTSV
jgi:hypothetical protein